MKVGAVLFTIQVKMDEKLGLYILKAKKRSLVKQLLKKSALDYQTAASNEWFSKKKLLEITYLCLYIHAFGPRFFIIRQTVQSGSRKLISLRIF